VIGLLSHLSRWGHDNHLLCHPDSPLEEAARGIRIRTSPITMRNEIDFRVVVPLRRLLGGGRYDILHFHTKRAHALSFWLGRPPQGLKRVVTRRMDYPMRRNWYERCLYNRKVDGVVAISEKIAALLIEGGVQREKIRVIYSGVDIASFENRSESTERKSGPVVGMLAALEERKGHRFLFEAAAELKRQGRRLHYKIAGDGPEREKLRELAAALGLQEEIEFVGFVSDVAAFLASIDLFVLPSLFEGLGVAALEAMAAGRPVVATEVGGLSELVEDRRTGLVVPPGDAHALARALHELISRESLMRELGENGRRRVAERFTMERMARQNEAYYYELIEAPGTAR
jgi:glycosyltransferase involved in cell wall biosynthesis